ncbi:PucR family transcriptional regulator [Actinomadura rubrobrunea]|uniref:PucR family transcriptional regulator n=1 Tax=Actinomadura rubrobrunea TaxID=115335 RepID=UPI000829F1A6|nr:helix-turn-helix domain-containing protein [Actinomadura rubrobrunea]
MVEEVEEFSRASRDQFQRAIRTRVPELTARLVGQLRSIETAYRNVPAHEPPQWIARSYHRFLDALALPAAEVPATLDVPRRTGARRGRQGVPERALLRAYHLGGRLLSAAAMEWAAEEGLRSAETRLFIETLWTIVDEHSAAAIDALHQARQEPADRRVAGYLLDALLNGETHQSLVRAVARSLPVCPTGRYAVVVRHPVGGGSVDPDDQPPVARGIRLLWRAHGVSAVAVAPLGDRRPGDLVDTLSKARDLRTGISAAVRGLAELGEARRQAESAARTLRGPGVALLEERLPTAMLNAAPDLARRLQFRVLAPLFELDAQRREQLLETLEQWLAVDGSVSAAATALYCHRNTVLNRLRRIEQLTGKNLSSPRDLIELGLAVQAYRQLSTPSPAGAAPSPRESREGPVRADG